MIHKLPFLKSILIALLSLCFGSSFAQRKSLITFGVHQAVTEEVILQLQFSIFYQDSIAVPFRELTIHDANSGTHSLEFDYKPGRYTLRVSKEGYRDAETQFLMRTRRSALGLGTLYMTKAKEYKLGEAVVKSTHIKMAMRGDTIVYDAAAFELANGSTRWWLSSWVQNSRTGKSK